jgi:hypothetical protein
MLPTQVCSCLLDRIYSKSQLDKGNTWVLWLAV